MPSIKQRYVRHMAQGTPALPPDRYGFKAPPPAPSLEERHVAALEEIANELSRIRRVLDYRATR